MVAIGPVVSEEKSFEIVDGRRTDDGRRTTEPAYAISSPGAFGSGELKINFIILPFTTIAIHYCYSVEGDDIAIHYCYSVAGDDRISGKSLLSDPVSSM